MDLSEEKIQQMRERLKPLEALPEFDGTIFPSFFSIREKGVERIVNDIIGFQSLESDILICAYVKSGKP